MLRYVLIRPETHEPRLNLVVHRIHLWEGSNGMTLCPGAMTDGATRLLELHLARDSIDPTLRSVLENAYGHLTSRDPSVAWTSGQWMTERPGGSDVSRTETVATYAPYPTSSSAPLACKAEDTPLGPWSISGFKFFSSATDANMTILLARTTPDKGLSAFFAPTRRAAPDPTTPGNDSELNGVRIQRLKDKLGTRPVPTAELELHGLRAWLLGQEGRGVHELATVLTITRVHSAIASLGYLARGLAVARAFALVRDVGAGRGRRLPLCRSPLHMRTLAGLTTEYHGLNLLAFYTVSVLGLAERGPSGAVAAAPLPPPAVRSIVPPREHVAPLLRVLSSLHKAYICKAAVPLLHACMEALGGVGYLNNAEAEPLNVARLFRDGCVNPIWEGTTDVLAADFLRALKHPRAGAESLAALAWLARSAFGPDGAKGPGGPVLEAWEEVRWKIEEGEHDALLPDARDIMFRVGDVLVAALLAVDASRDGAPEVEVVLRRFLVKKGFAVEDDAMRQGVGNGLDQDTAIVYGDHFKIITPNL